MSHPSFSRHTLDSYAANLRRAANAAKESAARADINDRNTDAKHWEGRIAGLMEAHSMIMAILTAGDPQISIGDEVAFDWPDQATPALTDIDAHYDVIQIRDGMVGVKRAIYRSRTAMRGQVHHWAPLTAVHRVHLDGNLCPLPPAMAVEGGAR